MSYTCSTKKPSPVTDTRKQSISEFIYENCKPKNIINTSVLVLKPFTCLLVAKSNVRFIIHIDFDNQKIEKIEIDYIKKSKYISDRLSEKNVIVPERLFKKLFVFNDVSEFIEMYKLYFY